MVLMDMVGYSLKPIDEQERVLNQLQEILRNSAEFQKADVDGDLISLPTGDGIALVFFNDPISTVQCAREVAQEVRMKMQVPVRMGIHSGPVRRVRDINGHENVTGAGIDVAQRVMDCGSGTHILISSTTADFLLQLGGWDDALYDLGECRVKHGKLVHLYVLDKGDSAAKDVAKDVRSEPFAAGSPGRVKYSTESRPAEQTGDQQRIALLYKRHSEPDNYVLKLLEEELRQRGYRVFVDRHISIGMEWATEIERQIRGADAVIPLLSEASVHSDMLEYEIQIAYDAAQQQSAKPRILPVRVNYQGPLSDPISGFLDPLQAALWQTPQDDRQLIEQIVFSLENPPSPESDTSVARLEPVGGAVPLDSKFYIARAVDAQFQAALARQDSIVLVKGPRQIGKTSLLARGLQKARKSGARVVLTDFQKLSSAQLETTDALFLTLARSFAIQLNLDVLPNETWSPHLSANENFERFLGREVLGTVRTPIVWGLDEVDRLFTCDFGGEVFALFRSWHNERSLAPEGPWKRLTMAIAYATEAHLFITDLNQSPFNVGTRLTLEDFTLEDVEELNKRYESVLRNDEEIAIYFALVGGHPYLVRRGLNEMATHGQDLSDLQRRADHDEGPFGDHLHRILVLLARDPELSEVVRGVLRGEPCPTPDSFYRLRSAGLMAGDSQQTVRPRCELYRTYLEHHLL